MCDEIIQEEAASLNKNENLKVQTGGGGGSGGNVADHTLQELPRMYGSDAIAENASAAEPSSSSHTNESRRRNLTSSFYPNNRTNNTNNNNNDDDRTDEDDDANKQLVDPSRYMTRVTKPKTYDYPVVPAKYDFQNLGTALPLLLMPTTTLAAPAPVNPIPPPAAAGNYYTVNEPNQWRPNYGSETYTTPVPNSNYFIANPAGQVDDYFYPIVCGGSTNHPTNRWSNYMDTSSLGLGYAALTPSPYSDSSLQQLQLQQQQQHQQQPWVVPYGNGGGNSGNYYTSLQPHNFYTNLPPGVPPGIPPQFICKRDCTPTTRFPTTRCTRRPGSPQPVIAWENNNTCCCELCGIACKGQFNRGKGPQYGPCKPPPLPMPNNRNALYCHGRRRKREYYLQAPKARQRLQRESDRCRITTTTTPKPRAWPTNYPVKFRLQKSIDAGGNPDTSIPVANQVSNIPMSPAASHQLDKILMFENQHATNNNIQVINENKSYRPVKTHCRSKNVTETASSKLRKKHNEIRMQELQETLEIALEKMNQEVNQ